MILPKMDARGLYERRPELPSASAPCPSDPAPGPCGLCGHPAPWLYRDAGNGQDMYACPPKDAEACVQRERARRAAEAAQPPAGTSTRTRPSQARTLLGAAQRREAGDG